MSDHVEWELIVNTLGLRLFGETTVSTYEVEQSHTYKDTVQGILNSDHKRGGRTDEEIKLQTLRGKAAEVGVAKILTTEVFDEEWIKSDRSSYSKDVVYEGVRIEVKSHHLYRRFKIPFPSYRTVMNNREVYGYDAILFAFVEAKDDGIFRVKPTLLVNPYPDSGVCNFETLWDDDGSNPEKKPDKVYRHDLALPRGLCYPYIELET